MFLANIQRSRKLLIVLIIMGMLLFGFFCTGIFYKMPMRMATMDAASMPVQSEQPCCGTTLLQHMESWKSAFLATPREIRDVMILFIAGLALALAFKPSLFRSISTNHELFYRLYARKNKNFPAFNYLKLAFAKGILNPKTY